MLVKEELILSETFAGEIVAAIFVLKKDGSALLQHRDNKLGIRHPNMWGPPGGHVEDNETELNCAKRELFEETDYYEENLNFLKYVLDDEATQYPVYKVALFWCYYDYSQVMKCKEGQNLRFVSRSEATSLYIRKFILDAWDHALGEANIFVKSPKKKS